jgi:hypothetical protein
MSLGLQWVEEEKNEDDNDEKEEQNMKKKGEGAVGEDKEEEMGEVEKNE